MRGARLGGVFITVAASLAIACNALTGAGDLEATGFDDAGVIVTGEGGDAKPNVGAEGGSSSSSSSSSSSGSLTCAGTGGTCAPKAPDGWDGPYRVIDEKVTADHECPDELSSDTFDLKVGTPTGSFTCPACTCQSPTGGACAATLSIWAGDTACSNTGPAPATNDATTCMQNTTGNGVGAKFRHSVTNAGKCDPAVNGQPQRGNIDWTTEYVFCGSKSLSAIGCASKDERCLAAATGGKICIVKDGQETCPAPFTVKTTVYGDVDDERKCNPTGCSCGDPTGVTCSTSFKTFSTAACINPIVPLPASRPADTCFTFEKDASGKAVTPPTAQNGSCIAGGTATSTGALVPTDEGTTCCLP